MEGKVEKRGEGNSQLCHALLLGDSTIAIAKRYLDLDVFYENSIG